MAEQAPVLVEVRLLGFPLDLYQETAEYQAGLRREFALISRSVPPESEPRPAGDLDTVPARLVELAGALEERFGEFTSGPRTSIEAALDAGVGVIDIAYRVPAEAADAAADFDRLLTEADEFCRAGRALLTVPAPPRVGAFRQWFLGEFVRQIGGASPRPWTFHC